VSAAGATLVVGPAWIGDMVLAQSLFQLLKRRRPDRRLAVAAPPWTRPLLDFMPEVDATLAWPFGHGAFKPMARWRLGRAWRAEGFDRAILLSNSFKSALVPYAARIPARIGYAGEGRSILLTDARRLDPAATPRTIDRFVALGAERGETVGEPPRPRLTLPAGAAEAALEALGLARPAAPVLALCPGAEYGEAKRWPAAHFAAVAAHHRAKGGAVWLFGGPADRAIAADVAAEVAADVSGRAGPGCVDLTGRTDLAQAVALLSLAQAVVTNDSGLMHVAAALGRRVVAVYGSSSPAMTPPLPPADAPPPRVLSLALACSPCYQRRCPLGHLDCLRRLEPARVIAALEDA